MRAAFVVAGAFLVVSVVYILTSDWLALKLAQDAEQLRSIQSAKGMVYVSVVAVGLLALTRALLGRIDAQVRELQSGREAMLSVERRTLAGTMAASAAHDFNNLVGIIKPNLAFVLEQEQLSPEVRDAVEDAQEAVERLVLLNERLRKVARQRVGEAIEEVRLTGLVGQAVEMIRTHSKLTGCQLDVELETCAPMRIYPDLIVHSVLNLVLNAADATDNQGHVRVSTRQADDGVALSVEDDGPGIPAERREAVVEPFVTSKDGGTGLGLFSVAYCADQHGGRFEIGDSELGGARMTLWLPLGRPAASAAAEPVWQPSLLKSS